MVFFWFLAKLSFERLSSGYALFENNMYATKNDIRTMSYFGILQFLIFFF